MQIDKDFEDSYVDKVKKLSTSNLTSQHLEHIKEQKTAALQEFENLKLNWGTIPGARVDGLSYPFSSPVIPGNDDVRVEFSWYVSGHDFQSQMSLTNGFKVRSLMICLGNRLYR